MAETATVEAPLSAADGPVASTVPLSRAVPPVLAVGAFLKNTVCFAAGREARVSHDVGNLDTVDAVRAFDRTVEDMQALGGAEPVAVAHDLHPDFHSTHAAVALAERLGVPAVPVQHHHAHIAAVMAEHGTDQPTLGLALDGFGLGENQEAWGGELLLVDASGYRRLGHLRLLAQPGGDVAARQPWRMAAAALQALGRGAEIPERFNAMQGASVVARMLERGVNSPVTSSCGRLFDAACGLLGIKPVAQFEGEAPMALEQLVSAPRVEAGGWHIDDGVLDLLPLLERLIGAEPAAGADVFHGTLAAALGDWVDRAAEATGVRRVALGGGCFFNRVLRAGLDDKFGQRGIEVMAPRAMSPGDPAISLGQVWVVAMTMGEE